MSKTNIDLVTELWDDDDWAGFSEEELSEILDFCLEMDETLSEILDLDE